VKNYLIELLYILSEEFSMMLEFDTVNTEVLLPFK